MAVWATLELHDGQQRLALWRHRLKRRTRPAA
jgi:hypothetical protein